MRASSHGPFRTLMMIVPLIAVAVLAYLGGYHYHTLAATQAADATADDESGHNIVVLNDPGAASPSIAVDDLFSDPPAADRHGHAEPTALDSRRAAAAEMRDAHDRLERMPADIEHPVDRRPSRGGDDRRPRRYPSAAMAGWQFAEQGDGRANDAPPHFAETTATQPHDTHRESDPAPSRQRDRDPRHVRVQDEIDARRVRADDDPPRRFADTARAAADTEEFTDDRSARPSGFDFSMRHDEDEDPSRRRPPLREELRQVVEEHQAQQPREEPRYRDPRTLKEATEILRELGIRKFKLETAADGMAFRFLCGVTDIHNPSIRRLFVAEGDEPLTAVRNVLRQIEDWRAQQ